MTIVSDFIQFSLVNLPIVSAVDIRVNGFLVAFRLPAGVVLGT